MLADVRIYTMRPNQYNCDLLLIATLEPHVKYTS